MNSIADKGGYKKNDPIYFGETEYENPKEYFKSIVLRIKNEFKGQPVSLIDFGCAAGGFIFYAKQQLQLTKCVGLDISEKHLEHAREYMPDVDFLVRSITDSTIDELGKFDVCTCLGTLSVFDEIDQILINLLSMVKQNGVAYIYDVVNDDPVDVLMRYKNVKNTDTAEWQAGFNIRSLATYKKLVASIDENIKFDFVDFKMPFPIPKTGNPMRTWTISTEANENQLVVGTGQMLNFKIICLKK